MVHCAIEVKCMWFIKYGLYRMTQASFYCYMTHPGFKIMQTLGEKCGSKCIIVIQMLYIILCIICR